MKRIHNVFIYIGVMFLAFSAALLIARTFSGKSRSGDTPTFSAKLGSPLTHHCGVVPANVATGFDIPLINDRAEELRIHNVDVTCGCLKMVSCPSSIEPGAWSRLKMSLLPKKPGLTRQRVTVITNCPDPTKSIFQIEVTANVRGGWSEPSSLAFGRVCPADDTHLDLAIYLLGYGKVELLRIESDSPLIRANRLGKLEIRVADKATTDGEKVATQKVRVLFGESAPVGNVYANLRSTWRADGEEIQLVTPVTAEITGTVKCVPGQIVWIVDAPTSSPKPFQSTVRLDSTGRLVRADDIKLSCDLDFVTAMVVESTEESVNVEVHADIDSGLDLAPSVQGKIIGKLDDEILFQVPILIVVRKHVELP